MKTEFLKALTISMATAVGLLALLGGFYLWHITQDVKRLEQFSKPKPETLQERIDRFNAEGEAELKKQCEREIGFRRIVRYYISGHTVRPEKWTADADVEVINQQGGVNVKHLVFKFRIDPATASFEQDHVMCEVDWEKSKIKAY